MLLDQIIYMGQQFLFLFTPENLILQVLGMTLGIIMGCLPGLNATLGIALLTPLTFAVPTANAIAVLMSLYVGVMFGGSISAILINIPGTGSAAATLIDGYPLAKKGQAANAIMVSRWGSALGCFIGLIFFVVCAPLLSMVAINFSSPEYFWLGVMGLLVCGSFSSPDMPVKGWIGAILGLLISFIGIEDIHAAHRFTYGVPQLYSGVELISVMMGFFGIPAIISALHTRHVVTTEHLGKTDLNILRFLKKNVFWILRWSTIGVWIGALPGVGENVAAFMAYSDAKKNHPDGPKMGSGEYIGVVAPEVGNDSAIGGAVLPMLTLGVPGSPPAAVLMGALMLHGLRPGPLLPTDNPEIIPQIAATLFIGTFLTLFMGWVLTKPLVKVLKLKPQMLMPIIATLVVVGAYAIKSSQFDTGSMIAFGFIGYILSKLDFNPAPLILGMILGPIIDFNMRRTLMLNDGSLAGFFSKPLSFVIISLIALSFIVPWLKKRRKAGLA